MNIQPLLERSSEGHSHLCPRQILGVRMGLYGLALIGLPPNQNSKQLLVIVETDGCFVDGIGAATNCTVGHRTLRVEDYGKVAATFIDTRTGRAIRIAPLLDIRLRACACVPEEPRHYFAQMKAYQTMRCEEMFISREVALTNSLSQILSRPGLRVNCDVCGEEVMNEREVKQNGMTLCYACAFQPYYRTEASALVYSISQLDYAE